MLVICCSTTLKSEGYSYQHEQLRQGYQSALQQLDTTVRDILPLRNAQGTLAHAPLDLTNVREEYPMRTGERIKELAGHTAVFYVYHVLIKHTMEKENREEKKGEYKKYSQAQP
jgi:hypothetical protein